MNPKDVLRQNFSADYEKYYLVELFAREGFIRQKCANCGKYFWSLVDNECCPDPPCTTYGFIGNSPAKNWGKDYIETWKEIEKFFVKNGHESIPSYPTVCRWFPGLYFTIASIVAFQRAAGATPVFEFPANPLIIPQVCLRFNDIPNVGVSGRHHTSFVMIGQHSLYNPKTQKGYWKNRCIELDWKLLTEVFKIPPEEISFVEDVWLGPAAFGYSLEYYVRGLELGNAVFTEFLGTPQNYRQMDEKIIDMGAGLERFLWVLHGTPTSYDVAFGPVIDKLKNQAQYDPDVFSKYASAASVLDLTDIDDVEKSKRMIAKEINVDYDKLRNSTEQLEAVYTIADHTKTLLYAIADGQLPSNVGGGYNLRVILRRALSAINEFKFDFNLAEICKMHADYLAPMSPHLKKRFSNVKEILAVEEERYENSRQRASQKVQQILVKNPEVSSVEMTTLYESHGITPELIKEIARNMNLEVKIPQDFYNRLAEKHTEEKHEEKMDIDTSGIPKTRLLFYEDQNLRDFKAKVLKIVDNKFVILDQTAFFARTGGQEPDHGVLGGCNVTNAEKFGDIVIHSVENPVFKVGDAVEGIINWDRRYQLMLHHTATHLVNGASRHILGEHVWQNGALKDVDKARLDITHYEALDDKTLQKIETLANSLIEKKVIAKTHVIPRSEAEKKYGFTIYQGGAVPKAELRIMEIPNADKDQLGSFDVEACGGTHTYNLEELWGIIITGSERIQDGVVRLTYVAGPAAQKVANDYSEIVKTSAQILDCGEKDVVVEAEKLLKKWKSHMKTKGKTLEFHSRKIADEIVKNNSGEIAIAIFDGGMDELKEISRSISEKYKLLVLLGNDNDKCNVLVASKEKNAGEIARKICVLLGGKGGGSPVLGQGSGRSATDKDVEYIKNNFLGE